MPSRNLRGTVAAMRAAARASRALRARLTGAVGAPRQTAVGYQNALLGETYMHGLINDTSQLNAARKARLRRYVILDQIMFWFLCMWGILGVLIAFYKTVMQPDILYSALAVVDDVDVVVMLDASRQMRLRMKQQHVAAMSFTWELDSAVAEYVDRAYAKAAENIARRKAEKGDVQRFPVFSWLFSWIFSWFAPEVPDRVHTRGGRLRTKFGTFNAGESHMHQGFTANLSQVQEDLKIVGPQSYVKHARLMSALESCDTSMPVVDSSPTPGVPGRKRYCIVFADNEALCDKHNDVQIHPVCQHWDDLCSPFTVADGNLLEYGHELQKCADHSRRLLSENDIEVLLMFTSGSEKEAQLRLKSKAFREFVEGTTNCSFNEVAPLVPNQKGRSKLTKQIAIDDDCVRFLMAKDFEELQEKSGKLAAQLRAREIVGDFVLDRKDYRFLWFILFALLPLFYVGWGRIINTYMQVQGTVKSHVGFGNKKKMVKVTKKLVEKERKTLVAPPTVATAGQEVELAEMAPSRPCVQFGDSMTLRALLKGGYLRANADEGVADGHGHAFGSDANWTFEPVDDAAAGTDSSGHMTALQKGQRVRIRGADGKLLSANGESTGFVDQHSADAQSDGAIFEAELVESESQNVCCLGDALHLKNCGTGRYLRVHKDGSCDARGLSAEDETQLVIDKAAPSRPAVQFGDLMTLRARLKGGYLRENADDGVADGHGHAFGSDAYWTFEPVDEATDATPASGRQQLQRGQRVRIRGADGKLLSANGQSTGFVDASSVDAQSDDTIFEAELTELDSQSVCCLGDTLRLKSCGTGRYLRVHKDGICDADGLTAEAETQFVVDRGGLAIQPGTVIQVTSSATGHAMHLNASGQVDVTPTTANHTQYWLIDKKGGKESGEVLRHGDVVTLKAITQNQLQMDTTGRLCAVASPTTISADGSTAPAGTEEETGFEFVVERAGLQTGKSKDKAIRIGGEVTLKPLLPSSADAPPVRANKEGQLWADGRTGGAEDITFKLDGASISKMISPLAGAMSAGDATLHLQSWGKKTDVSALNAYSAAWNSGGDLNAFVGNVVVASPSGQYAIPKGTKGGTGEGWVAVVHEGIDLRKAAQQAKAQGATGLIVRCQDEVSLAKLVKSAEGEQPELPAVFVGGPTADAFDERGLVLVNPECKSRELSDAMRTIAANAGKKGPKTTGAIFTAVGNALVAMGAGQIKPGEDKAGSQGGVKGQETVVQVTETSLGKYKWKVTSNTHYLWSTTGGGGATMMKVDYGTAAPPSAQHRKRVDTDGHEFGGVDASLTHNNVTYSVAAGLQLDETDALGSGLGLLDPEHEQAHRLHQEISQVLPANVAQTFVKEELADDSDFKIEYDFDEVELDPDAAGMSREDELLDHEGDDVEQLAVPVNVFWVLIVGMVVFTFGLLFFLYRVMQRDFHQEQEDFVSPFASQVVEQAVRVSSGAFMMPQHFVERLN